MVDTFRLLRLTRHALEMEDEGYVYSWLPKGRRVILHVDGSRITTAIVWSLAPSCRAPLPGSARWTPPAG